MTGLQGRSLATDVPSQPKEPGSPTAKGAEVSVEEVRGLQRAGASNLPPWRARAPHQGCPHGRQAQHVRPLLGAGPGRMGLPDLPDTGEAGGGGLSPLRAGGAGRCQPQVCWSSPAGRRGPVCVYCPALALFGCFMASRLRSHPLLHSLPLFLARNPPPGTHPTPWHTTLPRWVHPSLHPTLGHPHPHTGAPRPRRRPSPPLRRRRGQ